MIYRFSRRQSLRLALLGGLGGLLAACTSGTPQPAAPEPAPQPTAQPTLAPTIAPTSAAAPAPAPAATATTAPAAAAASTAPSAPAAPSPTAAAPPTVTPTAPAAAPAPVAPTGALAATIAQAATQFLAALDPKAREKATYAFDDPERKRWHWTTPGGFPRNGLPLKEMSQPQRDLALALLRASVSEAGLRKALDIISLQRDLGNDTELYYVTVFGEPGGAAPWGWRFEGHHLSRNFTIVGDRVIATPFFLGAWPTATDKGLRAMEREEEAARELTKSLTGQRRSTAIFQSRTLTNHVTQNQPHVSPLAPVGLPAGELEAGQQGLMIEIIQTYLGVLHDTVGAPVLDRLRSAGVEQIRFGWTGGLEPRQPHYYRLQGPTFLLEFDNSRNGGSHIHSVWRDFAEDFGQHLL